VPVPEMIMMKKERDRVGVGDVVVDAKTYGCLIG
jgi:hypothetical protein